MLPPLTRERALCPCSAAWIPGFRSPPELQARPQQSRPPRHSRLLHLQLTLTGAAVLSKCLASRRAKRSKKEHYQPARASSWKELRAVSLHLDSLASTAGVREIPRKKKGVAIVWFRNDLRTHDNPALLAAAEHAEMVPVYMWAPETEAGAAPGGAAQVWLDESLRCLSKTLESMGSQLLLRRSVAPGDDLSFLCQQLNARAVYFCRRYEPWLDQLDESIASRLRDRGVDVKTFSGYLLYEPSSLHLKSGYSKGHWGTLMPFMHACRDAGEPRMPLARPRSLPPLPSDLNKVPRNSLEELGLAAIGPHLSTDWTVSIRSSWKGFDEQTAISEMRAFVGGPRLLAYEHERGRADLDQNANSKLSAYLRWGQLSPHDLYWCIKLTGVQPSTVQTFERRLFWRDLAYFQLRAFPEMRYKPIRAHYEMMQWRSDKDLLSKWQKGRTGFPLVDASMRELWETGWSQQNLRMVAASFLTEYCNIDWVEGAKWYEDTLVDADIAINSMMWQNAGRSGIDQWNFVISPEKASAQDPTGSYVRKWVPELRKLPNKYLHRPWEAPAEVLAAASVKLGVDYPARCIDDLRGARAAATAAVLEMRSLVKDTEWNDAGGYDVVELPDGQVSRVFTRRDLRLPRAVASSQARQAAGNRRHEGDTLRERSTPSQRRGVRSKLRRTALGESASVESW
eukprot:TRINITY_DN34701_c0_g1_i1.p1 TRINITY_DN34701_c0_g1~~TRINITY_DN34701_c0_g1_i1.p1  ORF type:complete len:681 (+),score=79.45 TRINITY_DN34701_c0_g1_i1:49-2091(+)